MTCKTCPTKPHLFKRNGQWFYGRYGWWHGYGKTWKEAAKRWGEPDYDRKGEVDINDYRR